ncbi:hypothetical protein EXIGLDRAFT_775748 [Exidia glandulosa HHB12029]|uniref:Uncharacterized protein n=1 Tax=Exidia glandulosa HHB12029 TaxID=1314781 RepID=A0A165DSH0_EXIGL|nr:hypothetical protein EXIGLDRAFT_775748 [Exidia glandulosa HHB12029]
MGPTTAATKRGRKAVYKDSCERKRAYYERHAEREREKARDRWHLNQARKKEHEKGVQQVLARERELLPQVAKLTRGEMSISEYTCLVKLQAALAKDLRGWRPEQRLRTDRAQFHELTKSAVRMRKANEPVEAFTKLVDRPLEVVNVVLKLGRFAAALAACREHVVAAKLEDTVLAATTIRVALEELVELYSRDSGTLRSKQIDRLLYWQKL